MSTMRIVLFLQLVCFFSLPVLAHVEMSWVKSYNGPGNGLDEAIALAVDDSENVYVTGYSYIDGISGVDYTTIKYSPHGDSLWVRHYNNPANSNNRPSALAVDRSGNVYVTGQTGTVKYSPDGNMLWFDNLGGTDLAIDESTNVYVAGKSYTAGSSSDFFTIKYNANGDILWIRKYNGPANSYDGANSLAVDAIGNVYVAGVSYLFCGWGCSGGDYVTIKYGPNGDSLWAMRYNGPADGNDEAFAIDVDNSSNVYVAGGSGHTECSGGDSDAPPSCWHVGDYSTTIKYSPGGDTSWISHFYPPALSAEEANALAVDAAGNVYVTGDAGTIKYASDGDPLWFKEFGGSSLALDADGNVYVAGKKASDYLSVKYAPEGDTLWVRTYDGPGNGGDEAIALAVGASGNVYVTGRSWNGTSYDFATIKYVQLPSTDVSEKLLTPKGYTLSQNYPNPFNPTTKITYSVHQQSATTLKIYDLLGQEVITLFDGKQSAGNYALQWDGTNSNGIPVNSGIYFYRIQAGQFSETKKLVLVK